MPELPEVETVRRSLEPYITSRTITGVKVRERRLRYPVAMDFESRLRNRAFRGIERLGKYLLFRLDNSDTMLAHLGMSGSFHLRHKSVSAQRHDHVFIEIDTEDALVLNDPRRFGLVKIGKGYDFEELKKMGPDPLSLRWTVDDWRQFLRKRRTPIKNLLMDQTFIAGIGNIYANEMLFVAGIRPRRMAARLSRRELAQLDQALHSVLSRAVDLGGSSISDFRDVRGKPGYFQIHHAVYDRFGQSCRRCTTATIQRLVLSGRSTFYCPRCQS